MRPVSALLAAAALLAVGSATAFADEYYACDDGRLIRVKPGQLAKMIKSEPCLAAYLSSSKAASHLGRTGSQTAAVRRMGPPSKGPNIGTRFSRKRISPKPVPVPVARAKPQLRGPASTADEALPPVPEAGRNAAEAKAPSKIQGRLAEARAPTEMAPVKRHSGKTVRAGSQGDGSRKIRILNARQGQ